MSRQLEQTLEERSQRERDAVLQAVYGGLDDAVTAAGGVLLGFSVKLSGGDCLVTLRADIGGDTMISFVGGEDLPATLRKAVRELHRDQVGWRACRYGN